MSWQEEGYLNISSFLEDEECAKLRRACDHVLAQVLAEPAGERRADSSNIAFLTSRRYRGTYRTTPARRTFDVVYAFGPPPAFGEPAPAETFRDPEVMRRLTPGARAFFRSGTPKPQSSVDAKEKSTSSAA